MNAGEVAMFPAGTVGYLYYLHRKHIETLKPVRVGYLGDFAYVEIRVVMNENDKSQVVYPAMFELVRRGSDWKLCGGRALTETEAFPIGTSARATAGGYEYRFTLTREGGSWKPCQWGSAIKD